MGIPNKGRGRRGYTVLLGGIIALRLGRHRVIIIVRARVRVRVRVRHQR